MNWKLIVWLSFFGILMAFAGVYGLIPGYVEPALWTAVFIVCGIVIARRAPGRYFLHGFLMSVINGVWIAVIHAVFFQMYIMNNPDMQKAAESFPLSRHPRLMMLLTGPVIGALAGVVAGVIARIAAAVLAPDRDAPETNRRDDPC